MVEPLNYPRLRVARPVGISRAQSYVRARVLLTVAAPLRRITPLCTTVHGKQDARPRPPVKLEGLC